MAGRKFRKEKNEIRYHRVDLGNENESFLDDDESVLNRDLGPPKRHRNCGKITRGTFIVCTVLLTIAGLVSVVAYTAIVFPEGTTRQLNKIYYKVFGKNDLNSTSIITNSSSTINSNITTPLSIINDDVDSNETSTNFLFDYDLTTQFPSLANSTERVEKDTDNEDTLDNENVIKKTTRMKRKASTSIESRSVDSRDTDEKWNEKLERLKNLNDLELQDLRELQKHQTNSLVSFDDGTWKKRKDENERSNRMSGDESSQLDSKYTPYYYETTMENTVNPEEYDVELNQEEHSNYRVKQSIENDTLSKEENENVDIIKDNKLNENESGKISTTIAPTKNQKEAEQQSSDYWRDMKEKLDVYNDNNEVTIGFTIFLVITGTFMLVCCLYCRHKRRKAAKRRHFTRLVNDLNASEKFTLVTPSDEESD